MFLETKVYLSFSKLNYVESVKNGIWTNYSLCNRQKYYHCAREIHVTERIIKLKPIHASVIHEILYNVKNLQNVSPFSKNSIVPCYLWVKSFIAACFRSIGLTIQ